MVRIISGVTGIDYKLLKDNIELITPEISGNANIINSTVDSIFKSKKEYFNIEINYNNSQIVEIKNNVYLYNLILRQVKRKEDYNKVNPVIQININNYDKFKEGDFIYKSEMIETKYQKRSLTNKFMNYDYFYYCCNHCIRYHSLCKPQVWESWRSAKGTGCKILLW